MKRLLSVFCLLMFSCSVLYSQSRLNELKGEQKSIMESLREIDSVYIKTESGVAVQKVINGKGNKEQLYNKILEFLTVTYRDSKEVIQINDRESGLIIGKGLYSFFIEDMHGFGSKVKNNVFNIIKAECKDGRVRLTLSVDYIDKITEGFEAGGKYFPGSTKTLLLPELYDKYKEGIKVDANSIDKNDVFIYDEIEQGVFSGYQILYSVKHMLFLADEIEKYINQESQVKTDDNW